MISSSAKIDGEFSGARLRLRRWLGRMQVLPLDQLRGLPAVTRQTSGSGIYFLWFGPELRYVGKAVDFGYRYKRHCMEGTKVFTHATCLHFFADRTRQLEGRYVRHYRPPDNATNHG